MDNISILDCLQRREFPSIVKAIDGHLGTQLAVAAVACNPHLLLNKAVCLHQLGLFRKALKVRLHRSYLRDILALGGTP
jgi:hypothetical protein